MTHAERQVIKSARDLVRLIETAKAMGDCVEKGITIGESVWAPIAEALKTLDDEAASARPPDAKLGTLLDQLAEELATMSPPPWRADTREAHDVVLWGPAPDEFIGNVGDWAWQRPAGKDGNRQYAIVADLDAANARGIVRLVDMAPKLTPLLRTLASVLHAVPTTVTEAFDALMSAVASRPEEVLDWRWHRVSNGVRHFYARMFEPCAKLKGRLELNVTSSHVELSAYGFNGTVRLLLDCDQRTALIRALMDAPRLQRSLQTEEQEPHSDAGGP